jgi:hypothetical protein
MPSRSRASVEVSRPSAENRALVSPDAARTSRREDAHDDADAPAGRKLSDMLASRRCAAKIAAALGKLGYGFAVIPATAKPKRSSRKG